MVKLSDFIQQALGYEGVRYQHNGRGRTGMDCSGLLVTLARDFDLPHKDHPGPYSPLGIARSLETALDCQMVRNPEGQEPRVGDWGLFWFDRHTKEPQHVGMFVVMPNTGKLGMIHSYTGVKRVALHHVDKRWMRRLIRTYSFPEHLVERDC